MKLTSFAGALAAVALAVASPAPRLESRDLDPILARHHPLAPKVFIISMFKYEADIWYENTGKPGSISSILAQNITVPGFSMLYPDVHCTKDGAVCQLTTGESEINAATTIQALVGSGKFDLKETYFLVAGIAGINPEQGTLGSVALSKYAVQVALQYEFDARQIPSNWTTGYVPLGANSPTEYPTSIYGTEVFELNEALRDQAVKFAQQATLNDSQVAIAYRQNYAAAGAVYAQAVAPPSVISCDVATSDVYYSGDLLSEAFANTTTLFTNGSGIYCMTAQEDNATLEVLLRAAISKLVDFSRIIVMRTGSDFDREYPGEDPEYHLLYAEQGGFEPAIQNLYLAGIEIVQGILNGWKHTYCKGVKHPNYIGDIFGSLGGEPDFGPGSITGGKPVDMHNVPLSRRSLYRRGNVVARRSA